MSYPAPSPWRVVLADDAADMRLLVSRLLARDGRFEVVAQAGDGREAVEIVERTRPDLLVLDLSMPVMDGFGVLAVAGERWPETTVVVLSGFDARQMAERAVELGAVAYIEKGMAFESLAVQLAEALTTVGSGTAAAPNVRGG